MSLSNNMRKNPIDLEQFAKMICEKYPQLPNGAPWTKYGKQRVYFNHQADNQDYTFFIDCNEEGPKIMLKPQSKWKSTYPSKSELDKTARDIYLVLAENQEKPEILPEHICSEFFWIPLSAIPKLYVYQIKISSGNFQKIGGKLAFQFRKHFKIPWAAYRDHLVSTVDITSEQISPLLHSIWKEEASQSEIVLRNVVELIQLPETSPTNYEKAKYITTILRQQLWNKRPLEAYTQQKQNIVMEYEPILRDWVIQNRSALSISVKAKIHYKKSLSEISPKDPSKYIGLEVKSFDSNHTGEIQHVVGTLGKHRDRLLMLTSSDTMKKKIQSAPDTQLVFQIGNEYGKNAGYDYIASALYPIVRNENLKDFGLHTQEITKYFILDPGSRWDMVQQVKSFLKLNKYQNINSINNPELFEDIRNFGYSDLIEFGDGTIVPHRAFYVPDLKRYGFFKEPYKFKKKDSMNLAILYSIPHDLLKQARYELERAFKTVNLSVKFQEIQIGDLNTIPLNKTWQLEDISSYDGIIAVLPNQWKNLDQDMIYARLKIESFKHHKVGIQLIFEETIRKSVKYAMIPSILGLVNKIGYIPYRLAREIDAGDFFIGMDISRERKMGLDGSINFAAVARVYGNSGLLQSYYLTQEKIQGETIPKEVLRQMLEQSQFVNKTVVIHRDGPFRKAETTDILNIGEKNAIDFELVEVIKRNCPRLFRYQSGEILNPEYGNVFWISKSHAILCNNQGKRKSTLQPIRIRYLGSKDMKNQIVAVAELRLMHFASTIPTKLPITIKYSDIIARMFHKGVFPPQNSGSIPWWV